VEGEVTELRWVLTREQVRGAFCEPLDLADGSAAFARLQYREAGLMGAGTWLEIPVVSDIGEAPRLELIPGSRH
jgi:hypothetical protein